MVECNDRGVFIDHMHDACGVILELNTQTQIETWVCTYAGRGNVVCGTWSYVTRTGTLDLL